MKLLHRLLFIFIIGATFFPSLLYANLLDPGSTPYNPIYFNVVNTDPYMSGAKSNDAFQKMTQNLNLLESQYGSSNFNQCYESSCSNRDLANPQEASQCTSSIQICLKSLQMRQQSSLSQQKSCPDGYVKKNEICVTLDVSCKEDFGPEAAFKNFDSNTGKRVCACASGYTNNTGTQCVSAVNVPTNDRNQQCAREYPNSSWSGKLNAQGGPTCGCNAGYDWDQVRALCTQSHPVPTPAMSAPSLAPIVSGGSGGEFLYKKNLSRASDDKDMLTISIATLRSCPSRTCEAKGTYPQGIIFSIHQQYGDSVLWYRGSTPDGNEGWISSKLLIEQNINKKDESINDSTSSDALINNSYSEEPLLENQKTWRKFIGWLMFWK